VLNFCLFNELQKFAEESGEPKNGSKISNRNAQWRARRWEKGVGTELVHV